MPQIHPTAIVDSAAEIADDVIIGPHCIVEGPVKMGSGCRMWPHSCIYGPCEIGERNQFHHGAIIGHYPQDLSWKGTPGFVRIGNDNQFREYVTLHHSTKEGGATTVGNNGFFMATSHIAHDCTLGNRVIMANGALIAGHVCVGDGAFLSGGVVVHQFCRIGSLVMLQGRTAIAMHVPPFMLCSGLNEVHGINIVGLKRWEAFSRKDRQEIKEAYRILYRSGNSPARAVELLSEMPHGPAVSQLIDFLKRALEDTPPFRRGICPAAHPRK